MKSALFVDFDNVYSGLRRLDQEAADQFARNPTLWMDWVINSLALPEPGRPHAKRRVLVRRCYLNPQAFQRFRPSFNLAGFEIIDCPALTGEGKTSTDIHMVLDIVDLLPHEAHYDEFIVFSADADFTPVLRKLRRWDRRTTVLAIGFPSAAYRASADLLIDQDDFVRRALSFEDRPVSLSPADVASPSRSFEALAASQELIRHILNDAVGPIPIAKIASTLLSKIEGLDASTWGGYGSFRAFAESLKLSPLVVSWEAGGIIYDPSRHALPSGPGTSLRNGKSNGLLPKVAEKIKNEVVSSPVPVSCARLATLLIGLDGSLASDWAGKGTFRKFVESLDLKQVEFNWHDFGGVAYSPSRHGASLEKMVSTSDWADLELFKIARQIHDLTDVPLLSPQRYQHLLAAIESDVSELPFHLMETGKRVRDRCRDSGQAVSRADVNHVLRGILMRGHIFEEGPNDRRVLGRKLVDNVRTLCLREQIVLDEPTDSAINRWIGGN